MPELFSNKEDTLEPDEVVDNTSHFVIIISNSQGPDHVIIKLGVNVSLFQNGRKHSQFF